MNSTTIPSDWDRWRQDGERNHWELPRKALWPLRIPVVRHIRALWATLMIERHYRIYASLGLLRTGYDEWVVFAILKGLC